MCKLLCFSIVNCGTNTDKHKTLSEVKVRSQLRNKKKERKKVQYNVRNVKEYIYLISGTAL